MIISVKICVASTHYKLFKHHDYALVICGILMSILKSFAFIHEIPADRALPRISQNIRLSQSDAGFFFSCFVIC